MESEPQLTAPTPHPTPTPPPHPYHCVTRRSHCSSVTEALLYARVCASPASSQPPHFTEKTGSVVKSATQTHSEDPKWESQKTHLALPGPGPGPRPHMATPHMAPPWCPRPHVAPPTVNAGRRKEEGRDQGAHRAVVGPGLRSADRPVQAGPAYVDVASLWEGFQQLQQCPWVHIVVVIHVAEPPVGTEKGWEAWRRVPKGCQLARLPLRPPISQSAKLGRERVANTEGPCPV